MMIIFVVSSYGWNSFDELEHAKSLNIPVEKSQHYYKLYESRKLEKAFIEALNFDETDDNLDHVPFRTGREIDLFNKIQSNYFQSNVATIPKIIEAYNNSNSSGNRMRNDKELDNILSY